MTWHSKTGRCFGNNFTIPTTESLEKAIGSWRKASRTSTNDLVRHKGRGIKLSNFLGVHMEYSQKTHVAQKQNANWAVFKSVHSPNDWFVSVSSSPLYVPYTHRLKKYPSFCSLLNWRGSIQWPSSNPSSSIPSCCMFPIVTEVLRHGATSVGSQELQRSCLKDTAPQQKSPCQSQRVPIYVQVEGFFPEFQGQSTKCKNGNLRLIPKESIHLHHFRCPPLRPLMRRVISNPFLEKMAFSIGEPWLKHEKSKSCWPCE